MNKVTPEEVQDFIARHDNAYGGMLSTFFSYSRVVSLTWFEKIVAALNIADQEHVGIVSGSSEEHELKLLNPQRITLLNFAVDPQYDLDKSWSNQPSQNFSLTLCNQVLEHVFNPHQAFENLIHHTRPGGFIFVGIPAVNCAHGEPYYYSAGYHPRFLARLAEVNGLNLVGISSWGSIRYLVHAVTGTWLPSSALRPGYQTAADLRFPGLAFSDGRKEDCEYAKAMGFPGVVTDCWALYQKPQSATICGNLAEADFEFIQGEKFALLADNKKIFYRNTHDVNEFFRSSVPTHDFILISHNSDGNVKNVVARPEDADATLIPKNMVNWFAQNVCCENERIQALPIGLENARWFPDAKKIEKIKNIVRTPKQLRNLVYLNCNIRNNVVERQPVYDLLTGSPFVTVHLGRNGLDFDGYLNNVYNHCFMVCPVGNGEGVHQVWECLYINTIPIQKRSFDNAYYRDLPICFVDEWSELLNEEFLKAEYIRIKSRSWNLEKLDFGYWKSRILVAATKL